MNAVKEFIFDFAEVHDIADVFFYVLANVVIDESELGSWQEQTVEKELNLIFYFELFELAFKNIFEPFVVALKIHHKSRNSQVFHLE